MSAARRFLPGHEKNLLFVLYVYTGTKRTLYITLIFFFCQAFAAGHGAAASGAGSGEREERGRVAVAVAGVYFFCSVCVLCMCLVYFTIFHTYTQQNRQDTSVLLYVCVNLCCVCVLYVFCCIYVYVCG